MQYSKKSTGAQHTEPADDSGNSNRRRMGRIVHDDRGNAIVQWEEAPPDYERPVLEIESGGQPGIHHRLGSHGLSLEESASGDPYSSSGALERKPSQRTGNTSRTDLRKLSEWIKLMREMEQRKQSDGEDEE